MNNRPDISAILVCSASDPQLKQTLQRYLATLSELPWSCDLTIVGNEAAQQAHAELLPALQEADFPVRIVSLHAGSDESTVIRAGLAATTGSVVALLPQYLQCDPAAIRGMLEKIDEGADYVASWRSSRIDSKWNGFKSRLFNCVTRWLTGVSLHDLNSGLRVMRRELAEDVPIYGDLYRFWPLLAARQGYRVTEVQTDHLQERVHKGDYRFGVYLRRVLDLMTLFFLMKFTRKPLRFFGLLGSATLALGALLTGVLVVERLLGWTSLVDRPALIFGVMLIVLGVQLFSLGLLGELIIFTHGNKLRDYRVETIYEANRKDIVSCGLGPH